MSAPIADPLAVEVWRWGMSLAVPAIAGLSGVVVGAWLTARRERHQRRLAFIQDQLARFYSPMLGLRNEIHTDATLRQKIQDEASAAWQQICAATESLQINERQRVFKDRWPEFERAIEFDNERLRKESLPAYRKMVALFRDGYWLAEPSTREHYASIVEYVDIWERWVDMSLPREVLIRLDHTEEKLKPFYDHIQTTHDELRAKLKAGRAA